MATDFGGGARDSKEHSCSFAAAAAAGGGGGGGGLQLEEQEERRCGLQEHQKVQEQRKPGYIEDQPRNFNLIR